MISANELRVGNLVYNQGKVYKTTLDTFRLIDDYKVVYYGDFSFSVKNDEKIIVEPIPITKEWLLKFGFEKRNHLYSIDIDRYNKINYNSDQKLFFSGQLGFSIHHDINYVHQLQNLYFALIGKELEYVGTN